MDGTFARRRRLCSITVKWLPAGLRPRAIPLACPAMKPRHVLSRALPSDECRRWLKIAATLRLPS